MNESSQPSQSESAQNSEVSSAGGTSPASSQAASATRHTGSTSSGKGSTTATVAPTHADKQAILDDIAFYQNILDSETAWLASFQSSNGALPMTPAPDSTVKVSPYFSDFAALALLDGNKKYLANVKKYMDWHFANLNTATTDYNHFDGTIYDYNVTSSGGTVVRQDILISDGKKSYDSTDSYAATFLCVLWEYYEKSGDKSYIESKYKDIERILNALYSTMDDYLTYAKPDYRIQYFMDNCEVYQGLNAAIKLYSNILAKKYSAASARLTQLNKDTGLVAKALEGLWDSKGGHYYAYFGQPNFSWNTFYADATCQWFAINCGLVSPGSSRARQLYDTFNEYYSTGETKHTWESISIPDSFYWGSLVYTAALMNDTARVKTYMGRYMVIMKRHAYPLYNADAGKVASAAKIMIDRLNAQLSSLK